MPKQTVNIPDPEGKEEGLGDLKECKIHGEQWYKYRYKVKKNGKKEKWKMCPICIRASWRKSTKNRYQGKTYSTDRKIPKVRRALSLYLTIILIASSIMPE